MGKLFGTDGVRGIANQDLTPELAFKIGRAGAYVLGQAKEGKILIGRDTRQSGDMLGAALIAGILSTGLDVVELGIVPTPAVAYLTRQYGALAGVVISASHNPIEYNGIKFFDGRGFKLGDDIEEEIEKIILQDQEISLRPVKDKIGKIIIDNEAGRKYMDYLKTTIDGDLRGIKIAVDCGNGALYQIGPELLRELGAELLVVNHQPNGLNINLECGSTNPSIVQKLVVEEGADLGISFDGDADRLIAVDELGNIMDGDHILAICGTAFHQEGKLKKKTIVGTVMTNMGLDLYLEENGMDIVKTQVGDKYVMEEMLDKGYNLGGEQSGHIIFLDYNTTGDGLLAALKLMEIMKKTGKKMSQLNNLMASLPQVLVNARVKEELKNSYLDDGEIKSQIKEIEEYFHGKGRVLIRPSGTESLVRVMIEGQDKNIIEEKANQLASLIETRLGN